MLLGLPIVGALVYGLDLHEEWRVEMLAQFAGEIPVGQEPSQMNFTS